MLGNPPFYHSLLRKYVALFGSLFSDIYINRNTPDGDPTKAQLFKVPLAYANKDKFLARLMQDPAIERPYSALLPAISFELLDYRYDPDRKQISTLYNAKKQSDGEVKTQFVGVPYTFHFALYIAAKNVDDGNQIVEQILPFFAPEYTAKMLVIPEMDISHNIPISRNSIECKDTYDGSFNVRRQIIWTLTFTMKAYFYGPISKPSIIKMVTVDFRIPKDVPDGHLQDAVGVTPISERVSTQVTLTANGQPTANAAESIPFHLIKITDDFGYASFVTNYESDNPVETGPHQVTIPDL